MASPMAKERLKILDVEVDPITMDEAIDMFGHLIKERRPSLVFTINVDVCMKIHRDPELRAISRAADLVLVDGTPMMWAARFLGTPLPGRVSGADFVPAFCQVAAERGYRIFFLGGGSGIAEAAQRHLEARYPGLRIVGTYAPPFGFENDDRENDMIISVVRRVRPDVLFTAFGAPKQEKWLFRFRDDLAVPVLMSVGATFDYLAGRLKRAPMWMQRAGLEWTFRLSQEPRRLWRRYLVDDSSFAYHVLRQRFRQLMGRPPQRLVGP